MRVVVKQDDMIGRGGENKGEEEPRHPELFSSITIREKLNLL